MDSDNKVQFQANKELNDKDLELIVLFLENRHKSGGGDISEYYLNDTKRLLTVTFADEDARERVKAKKSLVFKEITLRVIQEFNPNACEKYNNMLIMTNLSNDVDQLAIELYAEHLVQNNEIKSVNKSVVLNGNTYYIEFKKPFEIAKVNERHAKKSSLFGNVIKLFEAYKMNSVIGKFEDEKNQPKLDFLELHFTNAKKSAIDEYLMLHKLDEKFYVLRLNSYDDVKNVLGRKHEIQKNNLILEEYYNPALID